MKKYATSLGLFAALSVLLPAHEVSANSSKELQIEPLVVIGAELRKPLVRLSDSVQRFALDGNWVGVLKEVKEHPQQNQGSAFIEAWAHIQLGSSSNAVHLVSSVDLAPVPSDYKNFVVGTLHWASGEESKALGRFERLDKDGDLWLRSQVAVAQSLVQQERGPEALKVLEPIDVSAFSADIAAQALFLRAELKGVMSEEGQALLKRISIEFPNTTAADSEHGKAVRRIPNWASPVEIGVRAEGLAARGWWTTIIQETEPHLSAIGKEGLDGCRFHYLRGRALYKRNRLKDSIVALDGMGAGCLGLEVDYGARALYLTGYASFRRGENKQAVEAYRSIADLYGESSYADDGLTRAGIALMEQGDVDGAQALWSRAVAEYPAGDTVPEARWRLAWTSYLEGDIEQAIQSAEHLAMSDLGVAGRFVGAGRYWAARWRMYADVERPSTVTGGAEQQKEAIARWTRLCEELPHSFYSILAFNRLKELAPEVANRLQKTERTSVASPLPQEPWFVRLTFLEDPHIKNGISLARVGLIREAMRSWRRAEVDGFEASEMAWMTELRLSGGDWLLAHDAMRQWMKSNPAGGLGEHEQQILRVAYPDRYWEEVKTAAEPMSFEPRLFHALVREESNFNQNIVSYAGARGLSQVMPSTAQETAKWLGMGLRLKDLFKPDTNLKIGAKYLDVVYKQMDESPFLALASYNAGPGRVYKWADRFGDVPIDEYVENIPIRQTRIYVKRVMESWQTYRWHFDEGSAFPDLSRFNHQALNRED